jgi:hypothetical protein
MRSVLNFFYSKFLGSSKRLHSSPFLKIESSGFDDNLEVVRLRITPEKESKKRWHIYNSLISESEIEKIRPHLKQGWYMHFWKENKMIVLFKGKKFILNAKDKENA